jgi:hypothetical protein
LLVIDSGTNGGKKRLLLPITCVFKTGSNHQTGIRDGFISMAMVVPSSNERFDAQTDISKIVIKTSVRDFGKTIRGV